MPDILFDSVERKATQKRNRMPDGLSLESRALGRPSGRFDLVVVPGIYFEDSNER